MLAAIVKEQVIVFVGPACNLEIPRLGPIISSQILTERRKKMDSSKRTHTVVIINPSVLGDCAPGTACR